MHYGISCVIFKAVIIAKSLARFWVVIIMYFFFALKALILERNLVRNEVGSALRTGLTSAKELSLTSMSSYV